MVTFWKLPLIYLAMMVVRGLCICLLNPIFRLAGSHMSAGEILFSTVGGLRGAISLILAQMLVTQSQPNPEQKDQQRVQAQVSNPWAIIGESLFGFPPAKASGSSSTSCLQNQGFAGV